MSFRSGFEPSIAPPDMLIAPLPDMFMPPDMFMVPPAMFMAGLGLRSSSNSIEGLVQEKSSSRITASWMPLLMALVSRTIRGPASRFCSCNPKCECIQRVPGGWAANL